MGSSVAILIALALVLGLAVAALLARRRDMRAQEEHLAERQRARERGTSRARLQYPQIDLASCLGCGTCVRACPEEGVLDLLHGQAAVVHGARCVGHGRCAQECPVGAIAVALGDVHERNDLPAIHPSLEAVGSPGVFLAGEVTGYALVRTAVSHGVAVADEVARRLRESKPPAAPGVVDLCIVGAGPAGIACALQAKVRKLRARILEQEALGGTVAKYPRRKLVMTQPVTLPLYGDLSRDSYTKEELMEVWSSIATEQKLDIATGEEFVGLDRGADGILRVRTRNSEVRARFVCLALGRRGTPRKLGAPGEDLPKVAYGLLDARSYQNRRILVVGGGDSAIEAALALAEQPGNRVTVSYRKAEFSRLKARNEARIVEAQQSGSVEVLFETEVARILPDRVELLSGPELVRTVSSIPNDEVFVLAGGIPPFERLQGAGVSFDPKDRPAPAAPAAARTPGLLPVLASVFAIVCASIAWFAALYSYYGLPLADRAASPWHPMLRPGGSLGLSCGLAAVVLTAANLLYLARRSKRIPLSLGSLQGWMTAHVATGVLALLLAVVHAAFAPRATVGGHALTAFVVVVAAGAIGRYFYAHVPRAANGRELALEEIRASLAGLSSEWDHGNRGFGERVRREVQDLVEAGRRGSILRRTIALLGSQRALRPALARLRVDGMREGLPPRQLDELLDLARRAHRAAFLAAHYEDLRGLLAAWRYFHRWVALLLVVLLVLHVVAALRFGTILGPGGNP